MPNLIINSYIHFPLINPHYLFDTSQDDFWQNQIPFFEEQTGYCQKYQKDDFFGGQFFVQNSVNYNITMLLVNLDGTTAKAVTVVQKATNISGRDYWDYYCDLSTLDEGQYILALYLRDTSQIPTVLLATCYSKLPIHVRTTWDNTVCLMCSNDSNDFDVAFENITGIIDRNFTLRVEGGFPSAGYTPYSDDAMFIDQTHDNTMLSSIPYCGEKLVIGGAVGVPNVLIDIINRFLSCTHFWVDDIRWQKLVDGSKLERKGSDNYPMAAWTIELQKGNSYVHSIEFFKSVELVGGGVNLSEELETIGWIDLTGNIFIIGTELINPTPLPVAPIPTGTALIISSNGSFSYDAIIDEIVPLADIAVTEWDGSVTLHEAQTPITAKLAPDSSVTSSGGTPAINITGIRPGDTLNVPDINYTDFKGVTTQVEAGLDIVSVIPDQNEITNSDGTVLALLDAEEDYEVADCVLTLPDSSVVNIPAATNYTVPSMAGVVIPILFPVNYSNEATTIIDSGNAGTYDTADFQLVNVASVSYSVNSVGVTGVFSVVDTDVLKVVITRTDNAIDSSVTLVQFATDVTFVTSLSSGYSPQIPQEFEAVAGQLAYTLPVNLSNNYWVFISGAKLPTTKYTGNAGQSILTFVDIVFEGGELITVINW